MVQNKKPKKQILFPISNNAFIALKDCSPRERQYMMDVVKNS